MTEYEESAVSISEKLTKSLEHLDLHETKTPIISEDKKTVTFKIIPNKLTQENKYLFRNPQQPYALMGELLKETPIPDIIRAEKLIPTARIINKDELKITFNKDADVYSYTLNSENDTLPTKSISVQFSPDAPPNADQTTIMIDNLHDLGYTDGHPRYFYTSGIASSIVLAFFDRSQKKAFLGHLNPDELTDSFLSKIIDFCMKKGMQAIECSMFGGSWEYLGMDGGFKSLKHFLEDRKISTKQKLVGPYRKGPLEIILDTDNMLISEAILTEKIGLTPFEKEMNALMDVDNPDARVEAAMNNMRRSREMDQSTTEKIKGRPIITSEQRLSLMTLLFK